MADSTPAVVAPVIAAANAPTKSLITGKVGLAIGTLGGVFAASAVTFFPAPYGVLAAILGCLVASLAGLSARPPSLAEGQPLVQGGALTVCTVALTALVQFYAVIPAGWPQSLAVGAGALLAWVTGHAMPALGTPSAEQVAASVAAGNAAAKVVADGSKAAAVADLKKV